VAAETLLLVLLGIFGGVIAGLGGPGGLPVIIGIFALTSVTPGVQAGTTSMIFAFATLFASAMYAYSGHIRKDLVLYLVPPTLLGTPVGVYLNQFLSREFFGSLIGVLAILVGSVISYRELKGLDPLIELETGTTGGKATLATLGFLVGMIGSLTGIGGPGISIPVLILLGIPVLPAIMAGLVQGFFLTSSSATNYFLSNQVSLELIAVIGIPYVSSQIIGWRYAQEADARRLKVIVSVLFMLSGLYLLI
jgi:uncharacterized membrane protein YfcA